MGNLDLWDKVKQPPPDVLKEIGAGRLKGKSDINPQWRYQALTEQFGPCGIGWKYTIDKLWSVDGNEGQIFAFALISLYITTSDENRWSEAIPGIGGSKLVDKESRGLYANDEGYKMAVTDALSVACKMVGVAADVYAGLWDGSKYNEKPKSSSQKKPSTQSSKKGSANEDMFSVEGIIQKTESKSGTTKGKEWTKYGITIDDKQYGTFEQELYDLARQLEGQPVKLTYKKEGKFFTCVSIVDDIPF